MTYGSEEFELEAEELRKKVLNAIDLSPDMLVEQGVPE